MEKVLIVGSGPSGVHFALSVLRNGYEVLMLDVGKERPEVTHADYGFNDLKAKLDDPVGYFLGEHFEGVIYPSSKKEYYGIPPSKNYVFSDLEDFRFEANGFAPLLSFAQGGLAEAWTGGVYPFNDDELSDFPFRYKDIAPFYNEVARRIGMTGVDDDLSQFMPVHENLLEPLELDEHSTTLLAEYRKHKDFINGRLKCYLGRSRVATLSQDNESRRRCSYLGRCLWGCPSQAFYTPSITLEECRRFPNFEYRGDMYVTHFNFNSKRHISGLVAKSLKDRKAVEIPVGKLVLAAGTLSSSQIFLQSIFQNTGEIIKLPGLMDNRQILIPFVNLKMFGKSYNPRAYQYHQVALGIDNGSLKHYLHGQITTLKTALLHPIIQKIPFDLKTSTFMFRHLHAALGLANVNFADSRREENYLTLATGSKSAWPKLLINYAPPASETHSIKAVMRQVKRALWKLKCVVPPGMAHVRPMGASVHYSGTIPMSMRAGAYTTSPDCRSHDFDNLYIVDGTTFPFLPAKNITFTLMANAVRVANNAFLGRSADYSFAPLSEQLQRIPTT